MHAKQCLLFQDRVQSPKHLERGRTLENCTAVKMDNFSKKKEQAARRDERALKRSLLREDSDAPKKTKMGLVEMLSCSAKVVDVGAASGSSKMEVENVPVGEVPPGEDSSSDMHCFQEVRVSRKLCLATIIQARQL